MLDVLKERLPEGLEIVKVKDRAGSSQMEIWFSYGENTKVSWLYKTCAPGREKKICDQTIASVMMGIALDRKDIKMVNYWHDKYFDTLADK